MALRKVAFGTAAIAGVNIARMGAQFIVVPILSRILSPSDYGLVAMAMPFVLFTMMFSDAGVGQSLVRTDHAEKSVWSTSFWLTMMLGLGLALVIVASAPVAALFFGEPRLTAIIMSLSIVVLMQAGATIPEASLRQKQRFGTIAWTEIVSILAGIGAAVIVAFHGGGAWALIAQQLVLYISRFGLTLAISDLRPRLLFHLAAVREHLIFGRDVLAVNCVAFISWSMDSFIVGRELGSATLGFYSMACTFLRLPGRVIGGPLCYVIYAHLVPMRDDKPLLKKLLLFLTRAMSIVILPGMGMVAIAWHPVFKLFLSEKWLASGNLFLLAVPGAALQTVTGMTSTINMVVGRTELLLRANIEFMIVLAITYLSSVHLGIEWFVIAYDIAVFAYFYRACRLVLPLIDCSVREYCAVMAVPTVATLACAAAYRLAAPLMTGDWPQLSLALALGAVAVGVSVLTQFRQLRQEIKLWS